jgi:hypothetical protein
MIMPKVNNVGDRATIRIRWTARIWGALLIAVTLIILIGYASTWVRTGTADPHAVEDYPPIENVPPLLTVLSVLGLGLAWRWEGLGGVIAVVCSLAMLPILLVHWPLAEGFPRFLVAPYGTWLIVLIPGVLFLLCWRRSKKGGNSNASLS